MKDSYACIISVLETSTNTDTQDTRDDTSDNKKENVTIKYPVHRSDELDPPSMPLLYVYKAKCKPMKHVLPLSCVLFFLSLILVR